MIKRYKLILFVQFLLTITYAQSQNNNSTWLVLSYDGFLPKVVDIENKSASDLYIKAREWAKTYYPDFEKELILDSTNYKLIIRSIKPEAFSLGLKRNLYDVDYDLIIAFKENKYRLEINLNKFYYNPRNTKYQAKGGIQETGWNQKHFYKMVDGEMFLDESKSNGYSELSFVMSEISKSLYSSMIQEQDNEDNDW